MRVLGIDLAAEAPSTGAVVLHGFAADRWIAREPEGTSDDDGLVDAARGIDVIGIDSPLGWPMAFVEAVAAHNMFRPWPGTHDRSTLTHRETDRAVRVLGSRAPLSVSADKLGSVAMRCALLQRRWADEIWGSPAPRDGTGLIVETYPAAALAAWGIECKGYKYRQRTEEARRVREKVLDAIDRAVGAWLDLKPVQARCVASDHVLDALASALVAVASKTQATHLPPEEARPSALAEGWIHLPSRPLSELSPEGLLEP
jgi:predicted nuclease with RNAse H fold